MTYIDILLPVPAGGIYTYITDTPIPAGVRVTVPLGRRNLTGIVIGENAAPDASIKYRPVEAVLDSEPRFAKPFIDFLLRMADYYANPPGLVLSGTISKTLLASDVETAPPKPCGEPMELTLVEEQQAVMDAIARELDTGFSAHLIHGITGSGKTEVYIELAKKVMAAGKQVLYLVPEISLTPQLATRLSERLGVTVSAFHSKTAPKKRRVTFWSFATGEHRFLLGARSALFIPAPDIGLIIVDEEHETSYKQDEAPSYNLRDMAVLYAQSIGIPVIMGSATPSMESRKNAMDEKYRYHRLQVRPTASGTPTKIDIVDMKSVDTIDHVLSEQLYDAVFETVNRNEQAILLLNRKGYAHTLHCAKCGEVYSCLNCSVSLTFYKSRQAAKCHYCGEEYRRFSCPECGHDTFADYGAGTERIVEVLETHFGDNVLRIDTDTVSSATKLEEMLDQFGRKEKNILVGTQLVAKGLHFPDVSLVGVVNIDNIFSLPDFRATERAFQLLTQVAGRSGRAHIPGRVIIQTMTPEAPLFEQVAADPDGFYEDELKKREMLGYPPYMKLARLILSDVKEDRVRQNAATVAQALKPFAPSLMILGPTAAPVSKIKNRHRMHILLKSPTGALLNRAMLTAARCFESLKQGSSTLKIDRDPLYFL